MTSAQAQDGPLVTTEWVEKNLDNPKVRIVEVSVEPGLFERGHIPGAQNVVWHTDLVETVTPRHRDPGEVPGAGARLGIDKDTTVVLYGDNNNWFAAWGAWVFDIYGVSNVKLLDGGRKKWEAEKRPLDTASPRSTPGNLTVGATPTPRCAPASPTCSRVGEGEATRRIVDIRSPDEFTGKIIAPPGSQELAIRAGHIPGAVNVPWGQAVNADGTIQAGRGAARSSMRRPASTASKPIIVYCRIGERSSHTWFVLTKLLGYDVQNYDGSWTEYGNSVGVPITNVAGTVWGGK